MTTRRSLFGWLAGAATTAVVPLKPPLGYPGNPVIGIPQEPNVMVVNPSVWVSILDEYERLFNSPDGLIPITRT